MKFRGGIKYGIILIAALWLGSLQALYAAVPPDAVAAYQSGEYEKALEALNGFLQKNPDDVEALKLALESYRHLQSENRLTGVVDLTQSTFEESLLMQTSLGILEDLHIKDLVPLADRIKRKPGKDLRDYMTLAALYERMGDLKQAVSELEASLAVDPENIDTILRLGLVLARDGKPDQAAQHFIRYLQSPQPKSLIYTGYAAAFVYPKVFFTGTAGSTVLGCGLILLWLLAIKGMVEERQRRLTFALTLAGLLLMTLLLGARWMSYRGMFLFWLLAAISAASLGASLAILLRNFGGKIITVFLRMLKSAADFIGHLLLGRLHAKFTHVKTRYRILVLLLTPPLTLTLVSYAPSRDLKLALSCASAVVFFTAIGSLALSFLERNPSLRRTLRYISIFSTIPFMIVLVYLAGRIIDKLMALSFSSISSYDVNALIASLILYVVGVLFAIYLAGIQANSILEPVSELKDALALVRNGDFTHNIDIHSANELGLLSRGFNEMIEGLRQREFIRSTFGKFVDARVVQRVLESRRIEMGGSTTTVAVMFSDIRGFTSMSEGMSAQELVTILNAYFTRMVKIIEDNGGLVNKFIGDAVMAVWGGVIDAETSAENAAKAALAMHAELKNFNAQQAAAGLKTLRMGIGINLGEVVAGHVGSTDRLEWTVMGDTVNLAQRAESKAADGQTLLTPAALESVKDIFEYEILEPIAVKGKAQPVAFANVTAVKPIAASSGSLPSAEK